MEVPGVTVRWTLQQGDDFAAGRYRRTHLLSFDGGAKVMGSSSPSVVPHWSDPAAVDPEELLIASVSSCHMLWFLDLARHDGLVVSAYADEPQGTMAEVDGKTAMVRVALRPQIQFLGAQPTAERVESLHHRAHALCLIANSIKAEVVVEAPPIQALP
jgi:organic hydroperoxide reductase OsmC/OhrA